MERDEHLSHLFQLCRTPAWCCSALELEEKGERRWWKNRRDHPGRGSGGRWSVSRELPHLTQLAVRTAASPSPGVHLVCPRLLPSGQ